MDQQEAAMMSVPIYHNPDCGTSRDTLAMIKASDETPTVIEYLKPPPSRDRLVDLIGAMGIRSRTIAGEDGARLSTNRPG
jgi:arsenate reductase